MLDQVSKFQLANDVEANLVPISRAQKPKAVKTASGSNMKSRTAGKSSAGSTILDDDGEKWETF